MSVPPTHLAKFDLSEKDSFESGEVLYRRFPNKSLVPFNDLFSQLRWEDIQNGMSVNRSAFARPDDVLWTFVAEDKENKSCEYTQKTGDIGAVQANLFPCEDPKTSVHLAIKHSPENCNVSHTDILFQGLAEKVTKPYKHDVKAFISSIFSQVP